MKKSIKNNLVNSTNSIFQTIYNHGLFYPTPINFNYAYSAGSLVGLFFALQIITGVFLAMHYTPSTENAFSSVVHIMEDVKYGYLMRYMHANGASMIFIFLYIHIGRGLYYRSYIHERRYLWWSGIIIFFLMMGTAFIGYVLPWGQMSFWGATVITSLVTAIPFAGQTIADWVWGGFAVGNATLVRFFSLHYLLPFIILGLIGLHLILLHTVVSTNPIQVSSENKIPFHPYYVIKDLFALAVAICSFMLLVHYYPNILGHADNFIPANPLVTPAHIVPEWYFTPFYAILRSSPDKLGGVVAMVTAILVLFILPLYNLGEYDICGPLSFFHRVLFWLFVATFFILLFLGGKPATAPYVRLSQIATFHYFMYFLFQIPFFAWFERSQIEAIEARMSKEATLL